MPEEMPTGESPTGNSSSAQLPETALSAFSLPDQPVVKIRPSRRWVALDLKELWAYRELLYFLTWRDVKVRYKQAVLGIAWAVIQPLATMVIFTVFFGKLAKVPSDGVPYPIFATRRCSRGRSSLNAVTNSSNSLVGSANLITKVYFPRLIMPVPRLLPAWSTSASRSWCSSGCSSTTAIAVTWQVLLFPVFVLLTAPLALGVGPVDCRRST